MNLPFNTGLKLSWMFVLLAGVYGCSPPDEQADGSKIGYTDASHTGSNEYVDTTGADMAASLRASGWRNGTLKIVVSVDQRAEFTEHSEDSGGRRTDVNWSFTLHATQERDVLVAPDLSLLLPETSSDEALREAYAESPLYIDDLAEPPEVSGEAVYTKRYVSLAPKANDFVSITEITDGVGRVTALDLRGLQPSYYGNGYQLRFHMDIFLNAKNKFVGVTQSGATVAHEDETPIDEPRSISFFPRPDRTVFDTYPFEQNPHLPVELADSERQLALQTLAVLMAVDSGEQPLGPMRPGLRWRGEKDQLTLHYESPAQQELPFMGLFGARDTNIFKIDITLSAKP